MGKLPDIEYAPVERTSDSAPAPYEAARGLSQTVAEGLTMWGQELVKTQAQRASVKLTEQLGDLEADLSSREYVTAEELRDALGDDLERLPKHLREQMELRDANGDPVDNVQIPMWAAFGAIYDRKARQAVEAAASGITMQGWRTSFKDRAKETVAGRKSKLNETQMQAALKYMKTSQLADFEVARNSARTPEEFAQLRAAIMLSGALDPEEKKKEVMVATAAEQLRPVLDASDSNDPAALKAQIARLEAGGEDVNHIEPKARNQWIRSLRTQLEAGERDKKEETDKVLKENARRAWNRIYTAQDAARRGNRRLTSKEYSQLVPRPGTVPEDEWRQMNGYLEQLTKPDKPKTDNATYWSVTRSVVENPDDFKNGIVTVTGADGKPARASLPQLFAAGLLSEEDFQRFAEQSRQANMNAFVFHGAVSDQDAIDLALTEKKFDVKTKDKGKLEEIGRLTKLINNTLAARAERKGKALEAGERDLIIREVLDREVQLAPRAWWNYLPFTEAQTQTIQTAGVRPEVAVAFYERSAKSGKPLTPEQVVVAAKDYSTFEPGILASWSKYGGGKPLSPDDAVYIYYMANRDKALIDEKLNADKALTGDDAKDNLLRAEKATRMYIQHPESR